MPPAESRPRIPGIPTLQPAFHGHSCFWQKVLPAGSRARGATGVSGNRFRIRRQAGKNASDSERRLPGGNARPRRARASGCRQGCRRSKRVDKVCPSNLRNSAKDSERRLPGGNGPAPPGASVRMPAGMPAFHACRKGMPFGPAQFREGPGTPPSRRHRPAPPGASARMPAGMPAFQGCG